MVEVRKGSFPSRRCWVVFAKLMIPGGAQNIKMKEKDKGDKHEKPAKPSGGFRGLKGLV